MDKHIISWKEYECQHCMLGFMVKQDNEHKEKNTCCPECRCVVAKKASTTHQKEVIK